MALAAERVAGLETAAPAAGTDVGNSGLEERLVALLRSYQDDARLTAVGHQLVARECVRLLANRMLLVDRLQHHPDTVGPAPRDPVVIVGLPRTGTTLLHHLLALDPLHRVPRLWEALRPCPSQSDAGRAVPAAGPDPRVAEAEGWLAGAYRLAPGLRPIHPMEVHGPEECITLMQNSFASHKFSVATQVDGYERRLLQSDLRPAYRELNVQLRVLAGGERVRRWILKAPHHLLHLDALLDVFAGARLVHLHRDPAEAVASLASLVTTVRRVYSDAVDPVAIGRHQLDLWAAAMVRALRARDQHGTPVLDLHYRDLVSDPIRAVRRVYALVETALAPEVEARMRHWIVAHPQDRHGRHTYTPEQFGLDADEIRARFSGYCERFSIEPAA